jgi:hypothetical protein
MWGEIKDILKAITTYVVLFLLALSALLGIFRTFGANPLSQKWYGTICHQIVLRSTCNGTSPEPFASGITRPKFGAG